MYGSKRRRFGSGTGARTQLTESWFKARTAPVVLPIAATALLMIGALVALTNGGIGPNALLVLACLVVCGTAICGDAATLAMTVVIAEFTAIGFARRPYADLRGGPQVWHAGLT